MQIDTFNVFSEIDVTWLAVAPGQLKLMYVCTNALPKKPQECADCTPAGPSSEKDKTKKMHLERANKMQI